MLMLDLCAGLGGASQAMRDRGWHVVALDSDPRFGCEITADLCTWTWRGPRPDLIWLSDPCTEFSRESMPWCKTGVAPDMSILCAGLAIIRAVQPRCWVRENVRGSARWVRDLIGPPRAICGPFFLWGWFPTFGHLRLAMRTKESYSSTQSALRAKIPYALSLAMALAIEQQTSMFDICPQQETTHAA